jgi:hypothetical protein
MPRTDKRKFASAATASRRNEKLLTAEIRELTDSIIADIRAWGEGDVIAGDGAVLELADLCVNIAKRIAPAALRYYEHRFITEERLDAAMRRVIEQKVEIEEDDLDDLPIGAAEAREIATRGAINRLREIIEDQMGAKNVSN